MEKKWKLRIWQRVEVEGRHWRLASGEWRVASGEWKCGNKVTRLSEIGIVECYIEVEAR